MQVLKLFEQFDAPDYVIRVAHLALDFASPDDPNIVSERDKGGGVGGERKCGKAG